MPADRPETCPSCSHPPHIGACSRRMGSTAYGCGCLRDTPTPPAPADARPMVVGGAFVKFDRPTPADDARIYPCADCGLMRSRSEGGTTFTVCDVCWDKAYPTAPAPDAGWEPWGNPYPRHPDVIRTRDLCLAICEKHQAFDAAAEIRVMHLPPAPDAGARIEEAHRALGKPGRMDDDGCCVGCGRSVQPSPCCPDFPVWPGPCRSCYAYDEEQRDAGAAERAEFEAWAASYYCDRHQVRPEEYENSATQCAWEAWQASRAALRGTNQAKRGNDARKGGEGA